MYVMISDAGIELFSIPASVSYRLRWTLAHRRPASYCEPELRLHLVAYTLVTADRPQSSHSARWPILPGNGWVTAQR